MSVRIRRAPVKLPRSPVPLVYAGGGCWLVGGVWLVMSTYRSHFELLEFVCREHFAFAEAHWAHAVPHFVVCIDFARIMLVCEYVSSRCQSRWCTVMVWSSIQAIKVECGGGYRVLLCNLDEQPPLDKRMGLLPEIYLMGLHQA